MLHACAAHSWCHEDFFRIADGFERVVGVQKTLFL
jgi:hypothetical protein